MKVMMIKTKPYQSKNILMKLNHTWKTLKKSDIWKIQLTIVIYSISSKYNGDEHVMHSKSDNIEIMSHDNADETIEELFKSLLSRCQIGFETLKKSSNFIFDSASLLYYKCHNVNPNGNGSYLDSPDFIKSKNVKVNAISKNDNKCFQYTVKIALKNEIKKDLQRKSKMEAGNEWITHQGKMTGKGLRKIFPQLLLICYILNICMINICPAYISKHSLSHENKINLLMIPNGKEFEGEFNYLWANIEKHKSFPVPITEEVTRSNKIGQEITKAISYKLQFIGSTRFRASSPSNLVDNLAEGIHKIIRKYGHKSQQCKTCGVECKDCDCCLECTNVKYILKEHKCLCCEKNVWWKRKEVIC